MSFHCNEYLYILSSVKNKKANKYFLMYNGFKSNYFYVKVSSLKLENVYLIIYLGLKSIYHFDLTYSICLARVINFKLFHILLLCALNAYIPIHRRFWLILAFTFL